MQVLVTRRPLPHRPGAARFAALLVLAGLLALGGCASIDFDYPRSESHVLVDTGDTMLAEEAAEASAGRPEGESGFHPLSNGIDALAARLLLARRAERSIDVQYYLIKNDIVGNAFVQELLHAADRGVRVRLLLDDMFTSGYDVGLAALDGHPNFEIRIFNPFRRGTAGRAGSALTNFGRINRRMHNKSFTVDNAITIIGGRNIADEYFGAREDKAFGDLDAMAVGPIVGEVSAMFDQYWNHETALPVPAFVRNVDDPAAALEALRERYRNVTDDIQETRYADAVKAKAYAYLAEDEGIFEWAPYRLVYDPPDKGIKKKAGPDDLIGSLLASAVGEAKHEVIIVSPYFVPLKTGVERLSQMQARGIDVTVITNSLAANNQFTVHAGYKPARKPLLQNGIRILEVRPDAKVAGTDFIDASGATATLHTKAFIVDREAVFIGSFNVDPRSLYLNTEMGVLIFDADLGEHYVTELEKHYREAAFEVFLDAEDRVRWRGWKDNEEVIFDKEPNTTWWDRFKVGFVGLFPIKRQL
ncbi:MAG: phospholipase D family protein [Woeseiaceae bacterium]|jgi:putative cardiolipin synthase|nr:phospholipase D family protein [Woeseiaceae bacterium]